MKYEESRRQYLSAEAKIMISIDDEIRSLPEGNKILVSPKIGLLETDGFEKREASNISFIYFFFLFSKTKFHNLNFFR